MMVLWEGLLQGLLGVWTVARVVIPLMIVLEIAQANGLLQRLNRILARPFRHIGLSEEGAFPVVVAMVFGLTFGSGVIINHVRERKITEQEVKIMGSFIAIAHALIEDTIIFLSLGAPLFILLVPRLVAGYAIAYVIHKRGVKSSLRQGDSLKSFD